jgi:hypothetical protein
MAKRGVPLWPGAATNGGIGKELLRDQEGIPFAKVPRNRRERRAQAAWRRKNGLDQPHSGGYVPESTEYQRTGPAPEDPFTDADDIADVLGQVKQSIEAQSKEGQG